MCCAWGWWCVCSVGDNGNIKSISRVRRVPADYGRLVGSGSKLTARWSVHVWTISNFKQSAILRWWDHYHPSNILDLAQNQQLCSHPITIPLQGMNGAHHPTTIPIQCFLFRFKLPSHCHHIVIRSCSLGKNNVLMYWNCLLWETPKKASHPIVILRLLAGLSPKYHHPFTILHSQPAWEKSSRDKLLADRCRIIGWLGLSSHWI